MKFTNLQLGELLNIITVNFGKFIGVHIGFDVLTKEEKAVLKKAGISGSEFAGSMSKIEESFKFGLLSEALGTLQAKKMNYEQFKKYLASGSFAPLNQIERDALANLKRRAYTDISGLGSRVKGNISNVLVELENKQRHRYEAVIGNAAAQTIIERRSQAQLASKLGEATKDWARDFDRISDYLMHESYDTGRALSILRARGVDALVFKDVYPQACAICIDLYLTAGLGSEPRLYKLSTLLANGTNIGVKAKDLKPIIGPTHPYCFGPTVQIYTSKGWKKIKNIKVGDEVLTHNRRFRKVTELIRHKELSKNTEGYYNITFSIGNKNLFLKGITGTHPFMTSQGWKKLSEIKDGEPLKMLYKLCEGCRKPIPVFLRAKEFCCQSCRSKVNATAQWADPIKSIKIRQSAKRSLKNIWDNATKEQKSAWTKNARMSTAKNHPNFSHLHTLEVRSSIAKTLGKRKTFIERKLHYFLDQMNIEYVKDYVIQRNKFRINGQRRLFYPDIFIPSLNIVIEADGVRYHNQTEDHLRDAEIKEIIGADTFRFTEDEIRNKGDFVYERLQRIVSNHKGFYFYKEIKNYEIIKLLDNNKLKDLYNFSVEEDESYVAAGLLVHNCRCTLNSLPDNAVWNPQLKQYVITRVDANKLSEKVRNRKSRNISL